MPFDAASYIAGKNAGGGGGGGGSSVTVEALNVTENGTTTAPSGKAYSPVVVNVPNSYAASDEGKVVSNGALVAQTAHAEVTQNGTIDTTLNNSVTVNVSGVARKSGTITFAERTAVGGYILDVGIDAAQFALYASAAPYLSNGRTFGGIFADLSVSTQTDGMWISSNASGSASSGSMQGTSTKISKTGTTLTFLSGILDSFQAGITYQWYAWGAES